MTLRNPTSARGAPIRPTYHALGAAAVENAYQERADGIAERLRLLRENADLQSTLEKVRADRNRLALEVQQLRNERDEARALGKIA